MDEIELDADSVLDLLSQIRDGQAELKKALDASAAAQQEQATKVADLEARLEKALSGREEADSILKGISDRIRQVDGGAAAGKPAGSAGVTDSDVLSKAVGLTPVPGTTTADSPVGGSAQPEGKISDEDEKRRPLVIEKALNLAGVRPSGVEGLRELLDESRAAANGRGFVRQETFDTVAKAVGVK